MISIITAIYNQLPMNHMFYESVCQSTDSDWELIIIDNGSTDGSDVFFEQQTDHPVRVIRNNGNYSYPYCQNEGIKVAQGDILAFLNNDILLSPHWDTRLMQVLGHDGYEILSLASNDRMANAALTKKEKRRWKRVKNPVLALFGASNFSLKLMKRLYFGKHFELYCDHLWEAYGTQLRLGFAGSAVIMTRKGLELIGGGWDETQQGADWDIFLQTQKLHDEGQPIQPMSIVSGIYHHHYSRLTRNTHYPPYKDSDRLVSCEQKWGVDTMRVVQIELKKDISELVY